MSDKIITLSNLTKYDEKVKQFILEAVSTAKDVTTNELRQVFTEGCVEEGVLSNKTTFTETLGITGSSQVIRGITYGNGYYVACGAAQFLAYSVDKGKTWIKKTFSDNSSYTFTGIAYGNGIFVMVEYTSGTTGNIWVTDRPEGEWVKAYSFDSYSLEGIKYANNTFLAVGTKGLIMKSDDGYSWKQVHNNNIWHEQNPDKAAETNCPDLIDITYGNGKYVACGRDGLTVVSINGTLWYDYTDTAMTRQTRTISYANGVYLRGIQPSYDGTTVLISGILYSTDGITWNQASIETDLKISYVRGFAYSNNRLYACAYGTYGEIYESTDLGRTWKVVHTNGSSSKKRLWCMSAYDGLFLAGGDAGTVVSLDMEINWSNTAPIRKSYYYKTIAQLSNGNQIESDVITHNVVPEDVVTSSELNEVIGDINSLLDLVNGEIA